MKTKALITGALVAILCMGLVHDAAAHRRGFRHGHRYRPHRVWVVPPAPPVVVIGPRYGYPRQHRSYYAHPRQYRGYHHRSYGYRDHSYGYRDRSYGYRDGNRRRW